MSNTRRRADVRRHAARKQPQQPRAEITYQSLVEAAERVVDQGGVEALTTNRVAEVAGVSIGSLYQYFPNKQALLAALLDRYMNEIGSAVGTTIAVYRDAPVGEILRAIADAVLAVYHRQRKIHRHLHDLGGAIGLGDRRKQQLSTVLAMVEGYLRAHPELDIRDPQRAAYVVTYAVDGVIGAFGDQALADIEREIDELVSMLTRYLVPRAGSG